jgi:hypothetical protein
MSTKTNQERVSHEIDMPETLEQALRDGAAREGISFNDYLCKELSEQLAKYERDDGPWLDLKPLNHD